MFRTLTFIVLFAFSFIPCLSQNQDLLNEAFRLEANGQWKAAQTEFDEWMYQLSLQTGELHDSIKKKWTEAQFYSGVCSHETGDYATAISSYKKAYDLALIQSKNGRFAFHSLINISRCYAHQMDIDSAVYYTRQIQPMLDVSWSSRMAQYYSTLGWIFQKCRLSDDAVGAYKEAAKYFAKDLMMEESLAVYFYVALCYDDAERHQKTLEALVICDSVNAIVKSPKYDWMITACRAIKLTELNKHSSALEFYDKSFELAEELDTDYCCGNKVFYSLSKIKLGQFEGVDQIIDQTREEVEELYDPREKSVVYEAIYLCYEALGKDSLALLYYKLYTQEIVKLREEEYSFDLARMKADDEFIQLKNELSQMDTTVTKERGKTNSYRWGIILSGLVIVLLGYLLYRWRNYKKYFDYDQELWLSLQQTNSSGGNDKSHLIIAQLERFITENCGRMQFSNHRIQNELGLPPRQINEILKAQLNTNISRFVNIVKVRKAQKLMCESSLTISEIAYDVGYSDPAYFTRIFKRIIKESPRIWREKMLEQRQRLVQ